MDITGQILLFSVGPQGKWSYMVLEIKGPENLLYIITDSLDKLIL